MNKLKAFVSDEILCKMALTLTYEDGACERLTPAVSDCGNDNTEYRYMSDRQKNCVITSEVHDGTVILTADIISRTPLAAEGFAVLDFSFCGAENALESRHDGNPWWMMCGFPQKAEEISPKTQNLLLHIGSLDYSFLPLCGDSFRCELEGAKLRLTSGCGGICGVYGPFLSVTASTSPYTAISNNFSAAREAGAIKVPLRAEKEYPEVFEKFGWCCWNTFYHEVTSEKLYAKLDEFREKHIPVKWLIIDDGWSTYKDGKLVAFEEDKEKFPEGLSACIAKMKNDYGIEKVGVWHAFNGYWQGIDPASALARDYASSLMTTANGMLVPSDDPEKAYHFWDGWHKYLEDCGVDFLKVDNQSSSYVYLNGTVPTASGARHAHEAIERSIKKHFGGVVIDCMGMDMENVLSRPYSAVSRNSDDFFPDRENGFAKHIAQNVYSALWHSQMYFCDYDMWWSGNSAPVESGVLRAISGGPVYVSDKTGESSLENILPVCGADGDICRMDGAAVPTSDCVYTDCQSAKRLLKVWNTSGENIALAVFNISGEKLSENFSFDVIPVISKDVEYIAYEYFTKKFTRVNFSEDVDITLGAGEVACYSLYPIIHPDDTTDEGAYILLGDTSRYISAASRVKVKMELKKLL